MSASCGGVRVGVDGAVAVDQHAIGEQHQEHAGHDRRVGAGADDLERRSDRVGRGVCGTRHHPVDEALVDHHRAEEADVGHGVVGLVDRHALVRPQLPIRLGELLAPRRRQPDRRSARSSRSSPSSEIRWRTAALGPSSVSSQTLRRTRRSAASRIRSSVPSGRHDAGGGRLGPLDQLVLEHDRRDDGRTGELDALARGGPGRRGPRTARGRPRSCARWPA